MQCGPNINATCKTAVFFTFPAIDAAIESNTSNLARSSSSPPPTTPKELKLKKRGRPRKEKSQAPLSNHLVTALENRLD